MSRMMKDGFRGRGIILKKEIPVIRMEEFLMQQFDKGEILSRIRQMSGMENCKVSTLEQLWKKARIVTLAKNQVCIRAREDNTNIYFILEGKVQIYSLTSCGKKKILFILGPENMANESIIRDNSSIFCETLQNCSFLVIPKKALLYLMEHDFELTKAMLSYQEKKMVRLEHQLKNTHGSIYLERRLASKLWKLAQDFGVFTKEGTMIDMDLSITFLSDFLGSPRETTSRVCKKLTDSGLILMNRKRITIPDMHALSSFYRMGITAPEEDEREKIV